ncbi:glycosyl transferase [Clostridia bacterium]|nr:glycosyl transferase [Clostridia bacterium]
MLVSVCIIAHNEEIFLPKLLENIKAQAYPHKDTEIVLVDNLSTDSTRNIMESFVSNNDFYAVQIITGTKALQATAWNQAISNAKGDIIIRLDAHSSVPSNFVQNNVQNILSGEYVCGGGRPNTVYNKTPWNNMLLAAEEGLFGVGVAKYRKKQDKKEYVSSIFHGAYRKEVFEKVGGFNESLGRTEDNEFHYRVRKHGYKIACFPNVVSYQYIRSTFKGMINQKFSNGLWIGLTLGVCPKCLQLFYFAPLALLLAYAVCILAAFLGAAWMILLLSAIYLLFDIYITITASIGRSLNMCFLLLPLVFPVLHFSYGIGTLIGIVKGQVASNK